MHQTADALGAPALAHGRSGEDHRQRHVVHSSIGLEISLTS